MSTIITKDNIIKIIKYILIAIAIVIGTYIFSIIINAVFNLGLKFGNLLRCIYSIVCG